MLISSFIFIVSPRVLALNGLIGYSVFLIGCINEVFPARTLTFSSHWVVFVFACFTFVRGYYACVKVSLWLVKVFLCINFDWLDSCYVYFIDYVF